MIGSTKYINQGLYRMPKTEMINIFLPGSRVRCRGCDVTVTGAEGSTVRGQNVAF